jgi:hypothetical protein
MSVASKALSAASKACQQLVKHYQQQSVGEIPKRSDVIYDLSICTQTYNAHTYRRASECVCIVEKHSGGRHLLKMRASTEINTMYKHALLAPDNAVLAADVPY